MSKRKTLDVEGGGLLLVGGLALFVLWRTGILGGLTAPGALDPTSDQNLAYKGVNSIGSSITGDSDFSFGGWLYDATHAPAFDPLFATSSGPASTAGATTNLDYLGFI